MSSENVCLIQRLIQLHKPVASNTHALTQIISCGAALAGFGVERNYDVVLCVLNFININRILHYGFDCTAWPGKASAKHYPTLPTF